MTIALSGYCTPDLTTFDYEDEPAFHEDYHELITYHAVTSLMVGVNDETFTQWRLSQTGSIFLTGIQNMRSEIFRTHGHIDIMGTGGVGSNGFFNNCFRVYPATVTTGSTEETMDALTLIDTGVATIVDTDTPQTLVATSTECVLVWIGPGCSSAGVASNVSPIFIGDISNQVLPVLPSDIKGSYIRINDASLLYIKGAEDDTLNYMIWQV